MREYLQSELAKRQDELKALEAQVSVLRVEVRLLMDVLARAPEEAPAAALEHSGEHAEQVRAGAPAGARATARRRRPKSNQAISSGLNLSTKWAIVRDEAVRRHPACITSGDIRLLHQRHGIVGTSSSNIRSHLYNGVQAGLYERVATAKYRATQKAANSAGFPLGASGPQSVQKDEASDDTSVGHRPSEASNGAGAWAAPGTLPLERR